MTLTTWLLCWYAVGALTLLYMWQDGRDDLELGHLIGGAIFSVFGPLIFIVGFIGSKLPDRWLDITIIRR